MDERVDIVDETGIPTGEVVLKEVAHQQGLLHRVVHVHLYDDKGNVIFQQRSRSKKHFPGMLHFGVGGHISRGEEPSTAIIREAKEELGIDIDFSHLELMGIFHHTAIYPEYGLHDNEITFDFAYLYKENTDHLIFEDGEVEGVQKVHLSSLINAGTDMFQRLNIVPYPYYNNIFLAIAKKIKLKEPLKN